MKKNFLLIFFILLSTFNYTVNANKNSIGSAKELIQIQNSTNSVVTIRLADDKKDKLVKKDLKEEIKRRKKYHKSLVNAYNQDFDSAYLELIEKNSYQLTELRKLLQV